MQIRHHIFALLLLALPACYPHQGMRPIATEPWLLARALQACERGDRVAAEHLLVRQLRDYPGSPYTAPITHALEHPDPCPVFTRTFKP